MKSLLQKIAMLLVLKLAVATGTVLAQTPEPPVSLPPTDLTTTSCKAHWQASPSAFTTGYRVEFFIVYPPGFGGPAMVNYDVANDVFEKDFSVGAAQGAQIDYRVRALNGGVESMNSTMQSFYLIPRRPESGWPVPCSYHIEQTLFHSPYFLTPSLGIAGSLTDVALDMEFTQPLDGSPFPAVAGMEPAHITGLEPATTYWVRFANTNPGVVSEWSHPIFPVTTLPLTPVLAPSSSTTSSVTVNWAAVPAATKYIIDVSKDNFLNYIVGYNGLNLTDVTSHTVTGLEPLTTYQVRIRAKGECDPTPNSNVVNISTLATEPVAPPTSLAFSNITSTSLTTSFTNAVGTPTGYLVLFKTGSSPTEIPVDGTGYTAGDVLGTSTVAYVGSSNSIPLTGLTPATNYFFDVFAYNGLSGYNYLTSSQAEGSASTFSSEPTSQPTGISFSTVTTTGISISFTAAAGSTGYLVLSRTGSAPSETPVDGVSYTVGSSLGTSKVVHVDAASTFADAGLTPGTVYHYSIFSYNGNTGTYNYLTPSPLQGSQITLASAPVLNTPAAVTQSGFQLSWTTITGATDYVLDVSADNFATFVTGYSAKALGNVTTTGVTGLSPGIEYKARIRAVNTAGTSANSNTQTSVTIPANPVLSDPTDITSSAFTVNWSAVTGATGYLLDISLDDFSNFVAGYNGVAVNGTTYTATSLNSSTNFKVRLRANNGSGASGNSNVISVTTNSSAPLAIGTINFSTTQDNATTQALNISVSGGRAPYVVVFKHRKLLESAFTSTTLTATSGGNYTFAITPAMLDEVGVAFEVVATDAGGATNKKEGKINAAFNETQSPALPFENFGGTDITWNLFSIPYDLVDKSVSNIFSAYDPARHEYDWKIMRYRTASNDYINFNTGQVKLGEAYWFNAKENLPIKIGAAQATTQVPFALSLNQGWNLIGNPYPINISWEQVLASNTSVTGVESLQLFNGTTQSTGDVVAPFQGGFVWADNNTQINIDPATAASGGRIRTAKKKIESQDPDHSEWMILFRLVGHNVDAEVGGIGMHPQATEQKDRFDAMAVPRFVRYSDLVSEHPEYFYSRFSTDIVPTQSNYTWNLTLTSNQAKGISQLTWDHTALQGKNSTVYLFDKSAGVLIDMSQRGSYPLDLARGSFKFDIHFSSNGEPFAPGELILGNAWPNPASSFVHIPLALPQTSQLDLSVYDMTGKQVATLAKGKFDPGVYTFTWDLSADAKPVNGLFIYRLAFPDSKHPPIQKKLILK